MAGWLGVWLTNRWTSWLTNSLCDCVVLTKEINTHPTGHKTVCFVGTKMIIKKSIGPDKPAIEFYAEKWS